MIRVVIDTTCLISALALKSSKMIWLGQTWREGLCLPLISDATRLEFVITLQPGKFKLTRAEQLNIEIAYLEHCEEVRTIRPCPIQCSDSTDQPFLDLALSGDAEVLVTGDRALVVLASQTSFQIETAAEFRNRLFASR